DDDVEVLARVTGEGRVLPALLVADRLLRKLCLWRLLVHEWRQRDRGAVFDLLWIVVLLGRRRRGRRRGRGGGAWRGRRVGGSRRLGVSTAREERREDEGRETDVDLHITTVANEHAVGQRTRPVFQEKEGSSALLKRAKLDHTEHGAHLTEEGLF